MNNGVSMSLTGSGTDEFDRVIGQPPASRDVGILVLPHKEPFVEFFELDSVFEFNDSFRHFGIVHALGSMRMDVVGGEHRDPAMAMVRCFGLRQR